MAGVESLHKEAAEQYTIALLRLKAQHITMLQNLGRFVRPFEVYQSDGGHLSFDTFDTS